MAGKWPWEQVIYIAALYIISPKFWSSVNTPFIYLHSFTQVLLLCAKMHGFKGMCTKSVLNLQLFLIYMSRKKNVFSFRPRTS